MEEWLKPSTLTPFLVALATLIGVVSDAVDKKAKRRKNRHRRGNKGRR